MNLDGADLRSATLRGVSLRNTTMTSADLKWASLRHANFGTFGSLLGFEIGWIRPALREPNSATLLCPTVLFETMTADLSKN